MNNIKLYPMKFNNILKSNIWGGDKIIPFKGIRYIQESVGESWELSGVKNNESVVRNGYLTGKTISDVIKTYKDTLLGKRNYSRFGNEFPLLIKFIDAKDDLSIQVHPDDELAKERHNSKGKTEMWYVINATDSAKLRSGFAKEVTPNEYVKSVEDNSVTDILKEYNVNKGDLFFLPAGRIHSIGAGCFIAEIQQTSDITYRIYDFNRTDKNGNTRELHTEQAKDAIDYTALDDYRTHYNKDAINCEEKMVECDYFSTSVYTLTEEYLLDCSNLDSFIIFICVQGQAILDCDGESIDINQGETILIPANTNSVKFTPKNMCKVLSTCIR